MFQDFTPKFVRKFANIGQVMKEAFASYKEAVADGSFPAQEHTYKIDPEILEKVKERAK